MCRLCDLVARFDGGTQPPVRRAGLSSISGRNDQGLSGSAVAALHCYHAVCRLVALLHLHNVLATGATSRRPPPACPLPPNGDVELREWDVMEGQEVELQVSGGAGRGEHVVCWGWCHPRYAADSHAPHGTDKHTDTSVIWFSGGMSFTRQVCKPASRFAGWLRHLVHRVLLARPRAPCVLRRGGAVAAARAAGRAGATAESLRHLAPLLPEAAPVFGPSSQTKACPSQVPIATLLPHRNCDHCAIMLLLYIRAPAPAQALLADPNAQAVVLHSSPAVVLADPAPTRLNAGIALSVAPLLGCDPKVDGNVAKWLHVHVRPSVRGLLRLLRSAAGGRKGGLLGALRHLVDGHWVLAFPDVERASNARSMVEQAAHKLRALYCELLSPLLGAVME